ncbi:MAG TPA: NYN domain-containing protein, partial [Thermoanaerobaculia bacterium]|nr:NYN domain-containing protein [Thermoanaerobaculia bacterium]
MSGKSVGIYVDVENITRNGGFGMQYDVLREFACRDGADAVRINAYVRFDEERARRNDPTYAKVLEFHSRLRDIGYKVIEKPIRWQFDQVTGERYGKANADMDMAVDMLLQSERLDRVVLATGDGDFTKVIEALQYRGLRIEVVAFDNVAESLRNQADLFISGYLLPNLLLSAGQPERRHWNEEGARVRGVSYWADREKKYGFIRFLTTLNDNLWIYDSRRPGSPYGNSFFHISHLRDSTVFDRLPNREVILEFTLRRGEKGWEAEDIVAVGGGWYRSGSHAPAGLTTPSVPAMPSSPNEGVSEASSESVARTFQPAALRTPIWAERAAAAAAEPDEAEGDAD